MDDHNAHFCPRFLVVLAPKKNRPTQNGKKKNGHMENYMDHNQLIDHQSWTDHHGFSLDICISGPPGKIYNTFPVDSPMVEFNQWEIRNYQKSPSKCRNCTSGSDNLFGVPTGIGPLCHTCHNSLGATRPAMSSSDSSRVYECG